jgi:hypothetical protein
LGASFLISITKLQTNSQEVTVSERVTLAQYAE